MSDQETFNKVLILCARDVHKSRTAEVRRKIPSLNDMTSDLQCMIKDNEDHEQLIFEASRQSGLRLEKFELKLTEWLYCFNNKQWCTMCGERPVRKGNRRFCSNCFSKASGKESIHIGSGHRMCHTGGSGRQS